MVAWYGGAERLSILGSLEINVRITTLTLALHEQLIALNSNEPLRLS